MRRLGLAERPRRELESVHGETGKPAVAVDGGERVRRGRDAPRVRATPAGRHKRVRVERMRGPRHEKHRRRHVDGVVEYELRWALQHLLLAFAAGTDGKGPVDVHAALLLRNHVVVAAVRSGQTHVEEAGREADLYANVVRNVDLMVLVVGESDLKQVRSANHHVVGRRRVGGGHERGREEGHCGG